MIGVCPNVRVRYVCKYMYVQGYLNTKWSAAGENCHHVVGVCTREPNVPPVAITRPPTKGLDLPVRDAAAAAAAAAATEAAPIRKECDEYRSGRIPQRVASILIRTLRPARVRVGTITECEKGSR